MLGTSLGGPGTAGGGSEPLVFGFVPSSVIGSLKEVGNWRVRADAIESLRSLVAGMPDPRAMVASLGSFTQFLMGLLEDPNFKISLTAMQILGDLVRKARRKLCRVHMRDLSPGSPEPGRTLFLARPSGEVGV